MIKKLLNNLKIFISNLPKEPQATFGVSNSILESIDKDLTRLLDQDPTFLDGPEGCIDYYSPHAEAQINNKQALLEKHINHLIVLQATLMCIHRKETQIRDLTKHKKESPELNELKKDLSELMKETNIETLLKRKDIQASVKWIGAHDSHKIEWLADVQKKIDELQSRLHKHMKLKDKIPKGMIDVKRALSLRQELRSIRNKIETKELLKDTKKETKKGTDMVLLNHEMEKLKIKESQLSAIRFSTSDEVDIKIKDMLEDLRILMTSGIKGYNELAKSGGDMDVFLHQMTGFYWENLYLYRKTLFAINDYVNQNASEMTTEGKMVAECINNASGNVINAAGNVIKEENIKNALNRVETADEKTRDRIQCYTQIDPTGHSKKNMPDIRFYKEDAVELVSTLRPGENQEKAPFFFIPYNSERYNIDHPPHTDLADALGNCYGETQMFLKRVNQKEPTFNNICPQTDLINFQLDQSRKAGPLHDLIGEVTVNLSQIEDGATHTSDKGKVTWDSIKGILTKEPKSQKNGDLCWIKLSGATVEGHDKEVSHVVGFIRMKNPDPYKYIVYDYGLGAMGFSNDEQLHVFFDKLLSGYVTFSKCVVEKVDEVSDECNHLFNGENGIQPLQKAGTGHQCERHSWTKQRLLLLVKYMNGNLEDEITLALEKIPLLKTPAAQEEVYQALFANKTIDLIGLLKMSISCANRKNTEPMKRVLNHPDFLTANVSDQIPTKMSDELLGNIEKLVWDGAIPAQAAGNVFRNNEKIVLAAFQKDPTAIRFADIALVINLISSKQISYNDACVQFPQLDDEKQILKLIVEERIAPDTAINVFFSNTTITLAAIEAAKGKYHYDRSKLAINACNLLMNEIRLLDNNQIIPVLKKGSTLTKLIEQIKALGEQLNTTKQALSAAMPSTASVIASPSETCDFEPRSHEQVKDVETMTELPLIVLDIVPEPVVQVTSPDLQKTVDEFIEKNTILDIMRLINPVVTTKEIEGLASVIVSLDESEPSALESGFPFPDGGSDSSGATVTEAESLLEEPTSLNVTIPELLPSAQACVIKTLLDVHVHEQHSPIQPNFNVSIYGRLSGNPCRFNIEGEQFKHPASVFAALTNTLGTKSFVLEKFTIDKNFSPLEILGEQLQITNDHHESAIFNNKLTSEEIMGFIRVFATIILITYTLGKLSSIYNNIVNLVPTVLKEKSIEYPSVEDPSTATTPTAMPTDDAAAAAERIKAAEQFTTALQDLINQKNTLLTRTTPVSKDDQEAAIAIDRILSESNTAVEQFTKTGNTILLSTMLTKLKKPEANSEMAKNLETITSPRGDWSCTRQLNKIAHCLDKLIKYFKSDSNPRHGFFHFKTTTERHVDKAQTKLSELVENVEKQNKLKT